MVDILSTALSGITASRQRALKAANNLSNLQTPGYHAQRANTSAGPGGSGAETDSISLNTLETSLIPTGNPLDLAISGNGFFQLQGSGGEAVFTRDGSFSRSPDGNLIHSSGFPLQPPVNIPANATSVSIESDGTVNAQLPDGQSVNAGQIETAAFSNPQGLSLEGGNLASATGASGVPQTGAPGTGGRGGIVSGFLLGSNVDIAQEMIDLRLEENTTRANVEVAKTADEMTKTAIDLIG